MIVIPCLVRTNDILAFVPQLAPGTVSRATTVIERPGGKPGNIAHVLNAAGIACEFVLATDAGMRRDVHVVDEAGRLTVINSPIPDLPPGFDGYLDRLARLLAPGDVLVVAGRQPAGAAARLYELAGRCGARLAVDTSGPDLRAALSARAWLVKVNAGELAAAIGHSEEETWQSAGSLAQGPALVVVTRGELGARAWSDGVAESIEVAAPPVKVVNPLGAGDALMAGLLASLDAGAGLREALSAGVAWATDSVTQADLTVNPRRAARRLN